MTETVMLYSPAPALPPVQQQLKATFYDDRGRLLQLDYNGLQQSFRMRLHAMQRLFFFETQFQKTAFRNEYGVLIGQVTPAKGATGDVRADGRRYRFLRTDNGNKLAVLDTYSGAALLTCNLADAAFGNLHATHQQHVIDCLVFSLAWTLS